MRKLNLTLTVEDGPAVAAADILAARSGLSKTRIKDAMNKGAVWIRKKGKMQRLRKATAMIAAGSMVELHYDERILAVVPPKAECIADAGSYSVWLKPAGLLSQGTLEGDHCCLLRQAELAFCGRRRVFLVHRLDREAVGLMLIAHDSRAAARLSALFSANRIVKEYHAEVLGNVAAENSHGSIDLDLDGRTAHTEYVVRSYDAVRNVSTVEVHITTGRHHQIRRHFDMIGHPVMGDPKYGSGNKNSSGMQLTAVGLRFRCPLRNREVEFILPRYNADAATDRPAGPNRAGA